MRGSQFYNLLQRNGWKLIRNHGNHRTFENEAGVKKTMGAHPNQSIPRGLLKELYERFDLLEGTVTGLSPQQIETARSSRAGKPYATAPMAQRGTLARKLFEDRQAKDLTQSQVAGALGVSNSMIGLWEQGRRPIRPNYLPTLIKFFNWNPEEIAKLRGAPAPDDLWDPKLKHQEEPAEPTAFADVPTMEHVTPEQGERDSLAAIEAEDLKRKEDLQRKVDDEYAKLEEARLAESRRKPPPVVVAPKPVPRSPVRDKRATERAVANRVWRTDPDATPDLRTDPNLTGNEALVDTQQAVSTWMASVVNQNLALKSEVSRLRGENAKLKEDQVGDLASLQTKARRYDQFVEKLGDLLANPDLQNAP